MIWCKIINNYFDFRKLEVLIWFSKRNQNKNTFDPNGNTKKIRHNP